MISIPCIVSVVRNDRKFKYILVLPQNNASIQRVYFLICLDNRLSAQQAVDWQVKLDTFPLLWHGSDGIGGRAQWCCAFNTLMYRQNGHRSAGDTFKRIFLNENVRISIKISLKFVPKDPINNIPALVQIIARHRPGDKPLSEPRMECLLTHICITRPQWVNTLMSSFDSRIFKYIIFIEYICIFWSISLN